MRNKYVVCMICSMMFLLLCSACGQSKPSIAQETVEKETNEAEEKQEVEMSEIEMGGQESVEVISPVLKEAVAKKMGCRIGASAKIGKSVV